MLVLPKLFPRSGVVRIDPIGFLAGWCTRRLSQALSVLSLSLGFLGVSAVLLTVVLLYAIYVFCPIVVLVRLSVPVIDWKDASPKWLITCWWGRQTILTHLFTPTTLLFVCRNIPALQNAASGATATAGARFDEPGWWPADGHRSAMPARFWCRHVGQWQKALYGGHWVYAHTCRFIQHIFRCDERVHDFPAIQFWMVPAGVMRCAGKL